MAVQHANLTGTQLHEPKGVSAATSGQYNLASSNSANWTTLIVESASTPSAATNTDITNLGNYRELIVSWYDLKTTVGVPAFLVSSDNGSSFLSSNYYNMYVQTTGDAPYTTGDEGRIFSVDTYYNNGQIRITNWNKSLPSLFFGANIYSSTSGGGGTTNKVAQLGCYNASTALDALRFVDSGGGTLTGTIIIEGIKG